MQLRRKNNNKKDLGTILVSSLIVKIINGKGRLTLMAQPIRCVFILITENEYDENLNIRRI